MKNRNTDFRARNLDPEQQPRRQVTAVNELAKLGLKLPEHNQHTTSDRVQLLKARNELRSLCNTMTARARAEMNKGGASRQEVVDAAVETLEFLADEMQAIATKLDLDEEAREHFKGHGAVAGGEQWRDAEGKLVQVLDADQRLAGPRGEDGIGFGEFLRAVAFGTRDQRIMDSLGESAIGTGGASVPEPVMKELIDRMRARTVAIKAGARTVMLDSAVTHMARTATDPTAGWRLENAAVTESDPTFQRVSFTARSLAVLVKVSRELLEDSVNIDEALMKAFAGALAVKLDAAALNGTGTAPEPRGILNTSGIGAVAAALTYGSLLDAVKALHVANAEEPTAITFSPVAWRTLQGLADTTNQPLRPPPALEKIPQLVTTSMPDNKIIVGNFRDLMIGVRSELKIELFRESFAGNLQVGFIAHLRADVQVAHPESFAAITTP